MCIFCADPSTMSDWIESAYPTIMPCCSFLSTDAFLQYRCTSTPWCAMHTVERWANPLAMSLTRSTSSMVFLWKVCLTAIKRVALRLPVIIHWNLIRAELEALSHQTYSVTETKQVLQCKLLPSALADKDFQERIQLSSCIRYLSNSCWPFLLELFLRHPTPQLLFLHSV